MVCFTWVRIIPAFDILVYRTLHFFVIIEITFDTVNKMFYNIMTVQKL